MLMSHTPQNIIVHEPEQVEVLSGSISAAIELRQKSKVHSTLSADHKRKFLANLVDPDKASIWYNIVMSVVIVVLIIVMLILAGAFVTSFFKDIFKKKKK